MTSEESPQVEAAPAESITPPQEAVPATVEPEAVPTELQTAQMGRNEPLPAEPEPLTPEPTPAPAPTPSTPSVVATVTHIGRDILSKARATIQFRKQKKLEKIVEFVSEKGKISNDEVEKLLHVSDATATRYLEVLVKQGKLKKIGTTGKAVTYTRI